MSKTIDIERDFLGMRWQRWTVLSDDSKQWSCRLWLWRLQIELFVYRHRYLNSPDRWVFKPALIYDRRK